MSVQPNIFDYAESQRLADVGIAVAAENNPVLLLLARELVKKVAMSRPDRIATADDVQREMMKAGYRENVLGNASGSVFRGREWEDTGMTKKSTRITAHARRLPIWRLKI